ncbi:MAG: hypothetical protein ACM3NH_03290 [Candidatus Saccharibacteria bacterium]
MNSLSKLLSICVAGVLAAILVGLFVVKPLLNTVVSLNQELSRKKTELKTLEQQIIAYKTAQSDLSKVEEKETVFNTIVDRENLVVPIQQVEAGAALTNTKQILKIEEQQEGAPAPEDLLVSHPGVAEVPYILTVSNDYNDLIRYLRYLEHLPQLTEVTHLEFVAESTERDKSMIHTGQAVTTINGVFFVKSK